jgi:hypothetical protein
VLAVSLVQPFFFVMRAVLLVALVALATIACVQALPSVEAPNAESTRLFKSSAVCIAMPSAQ